MPVVVRYVLQLENLAFQLDIIKYLVRKDNVIE
jgi:hypothetical protein